MTRDIAHDDAKNADMPVDVMKEAAANVLSGS